MVTAKAKISVEAKAAAIVANLHNNGCFSHNNSFIFLLGIMANIFSNPLLARVLKKYCESNGHETGACFIFY
jgi:hypothetical protein